MTTAPLADLFVSARSGHWGSEPGGADADVLVVRNGDVRADNTVAWDRLPSRGFKRAEVQKAQLAVNDILMTTSGNCGTTALVDHNPEQLTCATNFVRVLRPDAARADARYLAHFMGSRTFLDGIQPYIRGTAMKNLSTTAALQAVRCPLPDLTEQRRIADILDRAAALRARRRRTVALLDELADSVFLEMFGDARSNPFGWPRVPFAESCARVTVGVVVRPASYYVDAGVPALRSLNVREHRIDETELVFFSPEAHATTLKKSQLRPGDVVIVRTGKAGVAAVVPPRLHGANAIDLIIATPNRARAEPSFLAHLLNSHGGRSLLLGEQRGQIQQHLNVGALSKLLIPLPPVEQQKDFARRLKRLAEQRLAAKQSLDALSQLIAASQHRAFRGKL